MSERTKKIISLAKDKCDKDWVPENKNILLSSWDLVKFNKNLSSPTFSNENMYPNNDIKKTLSPEPFKPLNVDLNKVKSDHSYKEYDFEKRHEVQDFKKLNILSHWIINENGSIILNETRNINKTKFDILNKENDVNNITPDNVNTDNFPLIIVPSKEKVENIMLTNDLPMILEEITNISENYEQNINSFNTNTISSKTSEISFNIFPEGEDNKNYNDSRMGIKEIFVNKTDEFPQLTKDEEIVELIKKKHYKDKKTFCFYCEKDVSHFPRHLTTWHENETEVQRIFSYERKSKERRNALSILGKRGNYLKNRSSQSVRPVKRVISGIEASNDDFLPCPHCLGFYKRKSLYRHSKRCMNKSPLVNVKRQSAQSDGQTALLIENLFKHEDLLKRELFPRMRADCVTMIAKKDILICNYAYSYMKGRRSKGNLDLVRQNTRRLAKLLQYGKETNNEIKELLDLLRPTLFQTIVNGVNKIGGYNEENDLYESPTVAINFGTLIKKCCDLAYIYLLQRPNTENRRKELKVLKTLVESQWANEVSAQACTNLNTNKWNKEELLPLTSDLKKLKNYLEITAQQCIEELRINMKDQSAYNKLKEVLYTQIILMNRRRPAEVSQIKVETYKSVNLDVQENEFDNCLTEAEKILLNSCSRIVIRGKRGRGVPILLLSQKMREHFDFVVNIRDNFVKDNDYIFHTGGKSFLDGTKIVYKYAEKCGAVNPKSISATKLRKHLATVTQLLQFSKNDLEQLSRFMGHTLNTHCDFYRLSDSTYQTAKISKLLLLATEGGLETYKGLSLDDIQIDLNPIVEECSMEEKIVSDINEQNDQTIAIKLNEFNMDKKQQDSNKKITHSKQSWSLEQKKIIFQYFFEHIENKKAPKQDEITAFMEEYPGMFSDRKWTSIKAVVYNIYTGKLMITN